MTFCFEGHIVWFFLMNVVSAELQRELARIHILGSEAFLFLVEGPESPLPILCPSLFPTHPVMIRLFLPYQLDLSIFPLLLFRGDGFQVIFFLP